MKISLSEGTWDKSSADIVAIAIPSGKTALGRALGRIEVVTGKGSIKPLASDERFEGKASQTLKVSAGGEAKARWLLLIGVGEEKDAQKIAWKMGHALASTARAQKSAAVELPEVTPGSVRAVSHGLVAGAYRYNEYKSDKTEDTTLSSAVILGARESTRRLGAAVRSGKVVAESVNFARNLVNRPPNDLTPVSLARAASTEARKLGLSCRIWNKARIEKEGMNLLLAVNKGSAIEPRVIHVVYKPARPKKKVAFIGKGLTFDSGGLCIKPAAAMVAACSGPRSTKYSPCAIGALFCPNDAIAVATLSRIGAGCPLSMSWTLCGFSPQCSVIADAASTPTGASVPVNIGLAGSSWRPSATAFCQVSPRPFEIA